MSTFQVRNGDCWLLFLIGLTKNPGWVLVFSGSLLAFITILLLDWFWLPARYPIAIALSPWLLLPAWLPIAIALSPCKVYPARYPIAIAFDPCWV